MVISNNKLDILLISAVRSVGNWEAVCDAENNQATC